MPPWVEEPPPIVPQITQDVILAMIDEAQYVQNQGLALRSNDGNVNPNLVARTINLGDQRNQLEEKLNSASSQASLLGGVTEQARHAR